MKLSDDTLEKLCILRRRHIVNKTPLQICIDEERDLILTHVLGKQTHVFGKSSSQNPCFISLIVTAVVAFAGYITYSFII